MVRVGPKSVMLKVTVTVHKLVCSTDRLWTVTVTYPAPGTTLLLNRSNDKHLNEGYLE